MWFDAAELVLGDSLSQRIDDGLANCLLGIVILSPSFLAKHWTRRELDGLVAKESASRRKAILPILHGLTIAELAVRSPTLADRLAAETDIGVERLADLVMVAVQREKSA